jgi:5-methylcytosine-specific restriction endonuclease McrA
MDSGMLFPHLHKALPVVRNLPKLTNDREELYNKLVELYGEKCYMCGRSDVPLEIEHIIPLSAGGTNDITNLRLICPKDNAFKGNKFF